MINPSERITRRAITPNALYPASAAAHSNLHAGMATIYRSLSADTFNHSLPGNAQTLLHGRAAQTGLGPARNSLPASTAQVHLAQVQKSASTTVDTAALARDINAAVKNGGGNETSKSLNVSVASTQTPLQRWLLKAVNELSPAALAASPALLAAVQAGFQTQGGRQLALAAGIYDGSLVGDLSRPVAAAGSAQRGRVLTETGISALVAKTFAFDDSSIDPAKAKQLESMLTAFAENSLTFRNTLTVAGSHYKLPIEVTFDPHQGHSAFLSDTGSTHNGYYTGTIGLESIDDIGEAASCIVFETGNASIRPEYAAQDKLNSESFSQLPPQPENSPEIVNNQATRIFQGGLKKNPESLAFYVNARMQDDDMVLKIQNNDIELGKKFPIDSFEYKTLKKNFIKKLIRDLKKEGRTDFAAVKKFVIKTYTPRSLYLSVTGAVALETVELEITKLHTKIFSELKIARENGTLAPGTDHLLTPDYVHEQANYYGEDATKSIEELLGSIMDTGHTDMYFSQLMDEQVSAGHEILLPFELTDPASLSFEQASTSAGHAARQAVNTIASAEPAVVAEGSLAATAKASVFKQIPALAQKVVGEVSSFLQAHGMKALHAAFIVIMVAQLEKAIQTDVEHGDDKAHETRKVLSELLLGYGFGAALGAGGGIGGAALGSILLPGVGTAIGAFVGTFFGGMLGWAVGGTLGSLLYGATKKPIDRLINGIIAGESPYKQRFNDIVEARFKVTGDETASMRYAQTAARMGMTEASAEHFASTLTPAEGASDRFMMDLAGRLNATKQDWQGSVKFARAVPFLGIPTANATYASDSAAVAARQLFNVSYAARLNATHDEASARIYAQNVSSWGMTPAAAVHFASALSPAECASGRFMMDLAGGLNATKQDWQGSVKFARAVQFFGIPATNPATQVFSILGPNATYDSDSAAAAWMQTVFDARLKTLTSLPSAFFDPSKSDEDIAASLLYTQTASSLGMDGNSILDVASTLTRAEGNNISLMTDLAARLVETHQDIAASMKFILERRQDIANEHIPSSGDENLNSSQTRQAVYEYGSKDHFSDVPGGDQLYAANVAALGMNVVAGIYFSDILTTGEATSLPFLKVLAARLAKTHQDLQGSLAYVRSVM